MDNNVSKGLNKASNIDSAVYGFWNAPTIPPHQKNDSHAYELDHENHLRLHRLSHNIIHKDYINYSS